MVRIFVLVALLGWWPAATPAQESACALCKGGQKIACPTCKGSRRIKMPCAMCRGTGIEQCPRCGPLEPAIAKLLAEKRIKLGKGMVLCPNKYCRGKGQVTWDLGPTNPCRFCTQKGQLRCPECGGDGETACGGCAGVRQPEIACLDCAGSGAWPCPGCRVDAAVSKCPLCEGELKRRCGICEGADKGRTTCEDCAAIGTLPCSFCAAIGKVPCAGCGSTGMVRFKTAAGNKAGLEGDSACNKTGALDCGMCAKGRTDCLKCEKGSRAGCPACPLKGKTFCGSCVTGGYAFREGCGRLLMAAGQFERAAGFFRQARDDLRWGLRDPLEALRSVESRQDSVRLRNVLFFAVKTAWADAINADLALDTVGLRETVFRRLQAELEEANARASAPK